MTVADVQIRLDEIKLQSGDPERAHMLEDDLWSEVLAAIRDGATNAQELASEALRSSQIAFSRWYA